jgi:hypothetical protein
MHYWSQPTGVQLENEPKRKLLTDLTGRNDQLSKWAAAFFVQECPVCGRNLETAAELHGQPVFCQHCRAQFVAVDPAGLSASLAERRLTVLERAEQMLSLLESSGLRRRETRPIKRSAFANP